MLNECRYFFGMARTPASGYIKINKLLFPFLVEKSQHNSINRENIMEFELPDILKQFLQKLDTFIAEEIKPLEQQADNVRFFDHRREHSRTDWDNQGLPRKDW